jgi:hypothetical protein
MEREANYSFDFITKENLTSSNIGLGQIFLEPFFGNILYRRLVIFPSTIF